MDERVVQFRVGVMVLATLIIAVILALLFGELPSLVQDSYTIRVHFSDAPGVTKDTPVTKSGILIGRVTDVEFAEGGGVIVTMEIDGNRRIPRTDTCRISKSLLGDARVEFISRSTLNGTRPVPSAAPSPVAPSPDGDGNVAHPPLMLVQPVSYQPPPVPEPAPQKPPTEPEKVEPDIYLREGDVIIGEVAPEPIQVVAELQASLSKAIESVADTSQEFRGVIQQIGNLLSRNEQRIDRILERTDVITADLQQTLQSINRIVGDEPTRQRLQEAIAQMPELLRDTRQTVSRIGETMALVDRNLENIAGFTEPLGERGPAIVARLDEGSEKLDRLLAELLLFSQSLNTGQGTLNRLMRNPELYESVARTIKNVEELVVRLRPIVDDARVFSDKIARHPEVLGVRGAIQRNPGIK